MAKRPDEALEHDIMAVLWAAESPLLPGEIKGRLNTELAYTSVATVHTKGLVRRPRLGGRSPTRPGSTSRSLRFGAWARRSRRHPTKVRFSPVLSEVCRRYTSRHFGRCLAKATRDLSVLAIAATAETEVADKCWVGERVRVGLVDGVSDGASACHREE